MNQLDIDPGPELINSHGKFVKIQIFKIKRMLIVFFLSQLQHVWMDMLVDMDHSLILKQNFLVWNWKTKWLNMCVEPWKTAAELLVR